MTLEVGQIVDDRYRVEAKVASGGMAEVYKVAHLQLGSSHALKLLSLHNDDIRDRLLQEGRVQANLRHPNVVSVTDVVAWEGAPGLVMEFIEGHDLDDWIDEFNPSLGQILSVFRDIVSGVGAAHDMDLVHRDLKPGNILMERQKSGWVPRVCDFGLAKALDREFNMRETQDGMPMGTPCFMAPEQIHDAKHVDHRADLFALGAILYEMVTGHQAFSGKNVLEIFTKVAAGNFIPPEEHVPDLPMAVRKAIKGCMQVDRDKRIPSCDALLEVLADLTEELATDEYVAPTPMADSNDEEDTAFVIRATPRTAGVALLGLAGAGAATLAVLLLAAGWFFYNRDTDDTSDDDTRAAALDLAKLQKKKNKASKNTATKEKGKTKGKAKAKVSPFPCGGKAGSVVGYMQVGGLAFRTFDVGEKWELNKLEPVHKGYNENTRVVCRLPKGTTIHIKRTLIKARGRGTWVPIVADAIDMP